MTEPSVRDPNAGRFDEQPGRIMLDACCVINLFATSFFRDILAALPARFAVASYVARNEVLYVLVNPSGTDPSERERINLESFAAGGLLEILDLNTEEEMATYVNLSVRLEDGEAMTCALALHRGHAVATDERKVLHLLRTTMPNVPIWTTASLIKQWSEVERIPVSTIRDVLNRVRERARFVPNRRDPDYSWWFDIVGAV